MMYKKIVALVFTLFLTATVFADGEETADVLIEKYAHKIFSGQNDFVVRSGVSPTRLVVGAAYTNGFRSNDCCGNNYSNERAGVITVFDAPDGGLISLVDASKAFSLPSKTSGSPGAYVSKVVINKPDKFTIQIECDQCVGPLGSTNVRFHFALRKGHWMVSGMDRKGFQVVGVSTNQKSLLSGVVEEVSHNYRTGQRIVKTYSFDEANKRMKLASNVSTQSKPLQIPLSAFDPAAEILGQSR